MALRGKMGGSMGGRVEMPRRKNARRPKATLGVPKAGPVTVTRADGSVEVQPAMSRAEVAKIIRHGEGRKYRKRSQ